MKKIYVCSPFTGDVVKNRANALKYCKRIIRLGMMPVASHLLYPQMLDDSDRGQRELGLEFGLELVSFCDGLWVFGSKITVGMAQEIAEAEALGIPIEYLAEME